MTWLWGLSGVRNDDTKAAMNAVMKVGYKITILGYDTRMIGFAESFWAAVAAGSGAVTR